MENEVNYVSKDGRQASGNLRTNSTWLSVVCRQNLSMQFSCVFRIRDDTIIVIFEDGQSLEDDDNWIRMVRKFFRRVT